MLYLKRSKVKPFWNVVDKADNIIYEGVQNKVEAQRLIKVAKFCHNCFTYNFDETNYCEECGDEIK